MALMDHGQGIASTDGIRQMGRTHRIEQINPFLHHLRHQRIVFAQLDEFLFVPMVLDRDEFLRLPFVDEPPPVVRVERDGDVVVRVQRHDDHLALLCEDGAHPGFRLVVFGFGGFRGGGRDAAARSAATAAGGASSDGAVLFVEGRADDHSKLVLFGGDADELIGLTALAEEIVLRVWDEGPVGAGLSLVRAAG